MAACYGPSDYYSDPIIFTGKVYLEQQGVPDVQVCLSATEEGAQEPLSFCGLTGQGGTLQIIGSQDFINVASTSSVEICVADVDGEANGMLETRCETITAPTFPISRMYEMEETSE